MISAGKVEITVQALADRCLARVEVNRPRHLHSFFAGKSVDYMLQSVPLVFSICSAAQSVVALRAAEKALGVDIDPQIELQRDRLVSLETLHEHLWSLLMDLPPALGFPRWQEPMALASQSMRKTMQILRSQSCRLNPPLQTCDIPPPENLLSVKSLLFGERNAGSFCVDSPPGFNGVAAELLGALGHIDFQQPCQSDPLDAVRSDKSTGGSDGRTSSWQPTSNVTGLLSLLASADVTFALEELLQHQLSSGDVCESGPLARQLGHPWVNHYNEYALASRMVALLAETHQLLSGEVMAAGSISSGGPDTGSAELETARGRLACALMIDNTASVDQPAIVKHMQVIAPTDWHFHPKGIAAKLLDALPPEPELLAERAEVLVKLINPCIGYCVHICGDDSVGEMLARDGQRRSELVDADDLKAVDVNGYA